MQVLAAAAYYFINRESRLRVCFQIVMALDYANIQEWTVDETKQWAELHFGEDTALQFEGESYYLCYIRHAIYVNLFF